MMKNELILFMREVANFIDTRAEAQKPFDDFYTGYGFEAILHFDHPRLGTVKVYHGDKFILSDVYLVE